jgi:SAM-dependent methyltransferase
MNEAANKWTVAQNCEKKYWNSRIKSSTGFIDDLKGNFILGSLIESKILHHPFKSVLEIGIGGLGIGLLWLFPKAQRRIGIDPILPRSSESGNPFVEGLVALAQNGIQFIQAQGEQLPFTEKYFDLVICNNVLDHVEKPVSVLFEIHRVLRPEGYFALGVDTCGLAEFFFRKFHRMVFTANESYMLHPLDFTFYGLVKTLNKLDFELIANAGTTWKGALAGRRRRSAWILRRLTPYV